MVIFHSYVNVYQRVGVPINTSNKSHQYSGGWVPEAKAEPKAKAEAKAKAAANKSTLAICWYDSILMIGKYWVCIYIYDILIYIYIYILYYIYIIYIYIICICLTAFGVFRWPPWKELSCKLQTALAQAQQEHGFCVKHCVCGCFCVKQLFV